MKNNTLDYAHAQKIISFFDKKLGIEYFPGDKRFVGTPHEKELKICYGHIRGYVGADNEALDCYVSPNFIKDPSNIGLIFEVEQLDDGNFDEHKYMIGFFTETEAKEAYLSEMPEDRFGGIKAIDIDHIEKNKKNIIFSEQDLKTKIDEKYNSLNDTEKQNFIVRMVYEIVDENYGGKIQNFKISENPDKGYIVSGSFETPRIGGKKLIMGFDIDDNKIVLAPQNPEVLNHGENESVYLFALGLTNSFSEKTNYYSLEFFNFAQKQMNCTIGWSCKGENGYACLSHTKKNCFNNLNPDHRTYVSWLKDQKDKGVKLHFNHELSGTVYGLKGFDDSTHIFGKGTHYGVSTNKKGKNVIYGNNPNSKTVNPPKKISIGHIIHGDKLPASSLPIVNPSNIKTPVDLAIKPAPVVKLDDDPTPKPSVKPKAGNESKPSDNINDKLPSINDEVNKNATDKDLREKATKIPENKQQLDNIKEELINKIGKDDVAKAELAIQSAIDKSNIYIRTKEGSLDDILDGGFKNAHQLNGVNPYSYEYFRKQTENEVFGLKDSNDLDKYPLYGYFSENSTQNGLVKADHYGNVVIKLKKDVKSRATATVGDSLSNTYPSDAKKFNAASILTEDQRENNNYDSFTVKQFKDLGSANTVDDVYKAIDQPYIEAQIHGGLKPSDIDEITLKKGEKLSDKSMALIKKHNIKITYSEPKTEPKPDDDPAPTPKPAPDKNDDKFPDNLDSLVVVKKLGGTTGAQLVKDPVTGKQYVMKKGSSPEHLENEAIADSAYQALGINVPNHKVYKDSAGNPVKLAEYVEGRDLAEINKNGTQQEKDLVKSEIKKHFAADALLGNWDVVGMEKDNIMLGNDGKVYRIDNGGSLGYRAQGARKDPKLWNKNPLDLWSMRDKSINPDGAEYFGNLTHKEVVAQINDLVSKKDKLKGVFSNEDQEIMNGRIEEMKRVADISKTLDDDKWNDDYIGNFTRHTVGIRSAGITDKLPKELKQKSTDPNNYQSNVMFDENGNDFDNLRGKNSTVSDLKEYVDKNKGDFTIIPIWASDQSVDSWGDIPQAGKHFFANQRNIPKDSFWWQSNENAAKTNYEKLSKNPPSGFGWKKESIDETFTAMHAFTYEMLSKADIPNKNQDGTITLLRTEDKAVTKAYGLKVGDTGKIKRGVLESTSLVNEFYLGTSEVTSQKVPIHRIFATYFNSREASGSKGMFAGDTENEFVAMLEGLDVYHKSSLISKAYQ